MSGSSTGLPFTHFNPSDGYSYDDETKAIVESQEFSETFETRFGVELETCIRINPECIQYATNVPLREVPFKDKFDAYFRSILAPFCVAHPEFAAKYRFLGLNATYDDGNDTRFVSYVYSLTEPIKADNTINHRKAEGSERDLIKNYTIPIFEADITIECGDSESIEFHNTNIFNYPYNENMNKIIEKNTSFGIECITPILAIRGQATPEKVQAALMEMLHFFGLERSQCFIPNFSTGFHVNVSLYDTVKRKSYPITSAQFYAHLLEVFTRFEAEIYEAVRSRKPVTSAGVRKNTWKTIWAEPIYPAYNRIREFSDRFLENMIGGRGVNLPEDIKKKMKQYLFRQILLTHSAGVNNNNNSIDSRLTRYIRSEHPEVAENISRLSAKTQSIKKKKDGVLEFRLFQSERNPELLSQYTYDIINIIQNTYKYMSMHIELEPAVVIEELNNESEGAAGGGTYIEELNGGYRRNRRRKLRRSTQSKKLKKSNRKRHTKCRK